MYDTPIGVGIWGTGRISDLHAIEYLQNPDAGIVALCDMNPQTAKAKAEAWGLGSVEITDDQNQFLSNENIDLVEILLPHHLHLEAALAAINAGKAVSLQKPICPSVEDADRLVEAAAASDRPFKVFENFVFYPPVQKAIRLVGNNAIGEPLSIRIKSNPGTSRTEWKIPQGANEWRQDQNRSGGGPLVFDDGHHKFALAWLFMGNPDSVHSYIGSTVRSDGYVFDAQSIISFRFPNNRIGNLEIVYSPELEIDTRHYAQDDRVEITGTKGVIWINGGHGRLGDAPPVVLHCDGQRTEFRDVATGWEQSFVLSTRHYIETLKNGGQPILTADEARQVLRFALAAEQSARDGMAVDLDSGGD